MRKGDASGGRDARQGIASCCLLSPLRWSRAQLRLRRTSRAACWAALRPEERHAVAGAARAAVAVRAAGQLRRLRRRPRCRRADTNRPSAKPDRSRVAKSEAAPRKMTSSKPRQKSAVAARKPKANPLNSYARDARRQTWPCAGGGICAWTHSRARSALGIQLARHGDARSLRRAGAADVELAIARDDVLAAQEADAVRAALRAAQRIRPSGS